MKERPLLECPTCKVPWQIEHVLTGWAAVRPGEWWAPTSQHWLARCACTVLLGTQEGDLYRQMPGVDYA